jgi:hypothetical protein
MDFIIFRIRYVHPYIYPDSNRFQWVVKIGRHAYNRSTTWSSLYMSMKFDLRNAGCFFNENVRFFSQTKKLSSTKTSGTHLGPILPNTISPILHIL